MRIFLAGGSSVIGRALIPRLVGSGHRVTATSRSESGADTIRWLGGEPVICDVFHRERLLEVVAGAQPEVVVHQLTSIPSRLEPRRIADQLAPTNRLRTEGTRNLLRAAVAARARRLVVQSIAFVHTPGRGPLRTEEDPPFMHAPSAYRGMIEAVHELETLTTTSREVEGVALRYGFFYGPGTAYGPGGSFYEDVQRRRVPLVAGGRGVFSFVSVEDAAEATIAALGDCRPGVYQIVDDDPAPVREWLPRYAELVGARPPLRVPALLARLVAGPYGLYMMVEQPGVSNALAKRELGWSPKPKSWRQGFAELFGESG